MGGTSADIAVMRSGAPEFATATRVGDFPLILPVVDVARDRRRRRLDRVGGRQGVLKVGPHSAGADPGPVCYGRGGAEPTVTDCYLALGIIDPRPLPRRRG